MFIVWLLEGAHHERQALIAPHILGGVLFVRWFGGPGNPCPIGVLMQCRFKEERRSCEDDVLKAGFAFVCGIAEVSLSLEDSSCEGGVSREDAFPEVGICREGAFLEVGIVPEGAFPEVGICRESACPEVGTFPEGAFPEAGTFPEAASPKVGLSREAACREVGIFRESACPKVGIFREGACPEVGLSREAASAEVNGNGKVKVLEIDGCCEIQARQRDRLGTSLRQARDISCDPHFVGTENRKDSGRPSAPLQIGRRRVPNQMAHVAIPKIPVCRVIFSSGSEHVPWILGSWPKCRGEWFCHGGC